MHSKWNTPLHSSQITWGDFPSGSTPHMVQGEASSNSWRRLNTLTLCLSEYHEHSRQDWCADTSTTEESTTEAVKASKWNWSSGYEGSLDRASAFWCNLPLRYLTSKLNSERKRPQRASLGDALLVARCYRAEWSVTKVNYYYPRRYDRNLESPKIMAKSSPSVGA